ncbi:hypothetical protein HYS97_03740 [Candidatus Daviesbacteria bacterium]|nr:hypothetical protein [Candidatus Daviesbacteria bacterium]
MPALKGAKSFTSWGGVEQSWIRVWLSRYKANKEKLINAYFFHGDIFKRHYYPADIIYIYLLKEGVYKLEAKLKDELKKGAIIITQKYHFKSWAPFKKIADFWFYKQV